MVLVVNPLNTVRKLWRVRTWIRISLVVGLCIAVAQSRREAQFVEWEELEKAENEESPLRLRELLKRYAFATHRKKTRIQSSVFHMEDHVRHRKILDYQKAEGTQSSPPENAGSLDVVGGEGTETMKYPDGRSGSGFGYSGDTDPATYWIGGLSDGIKLDGSGEINVVEDAMSKRPSDIDAHSTPRKLNVPIHSTIVSKGTATHNTISASSTGDTLDESATFRFPTHSASSTTDGEMTSTAEDSLLTHYNDATDMLSLEASSTRKAMTGVDQNDDTVVDETTRTADGTFPMNDEGHGFHKDKQPSTTNIFHVGGKADTMTSRDYILSTKSGKIRDGNTRLSTTQEIRDKEFDSGTGDERNTADRFNANPGQGSHGFMGTTDIDEVDSDTTSGYPNLDTKKDGIEITISPKSGTRTLHPNQSSGPMYSSTHKGTTRENNRNIPYTSGDPITATFGNHELGNRDDTSNKQSTLSSPTESSLDNSIPDIHITDPVTLAHPPADINNVATITAPAIEGIPKTYPTVTETLSLTTFHFTNDVHVSATIHNNVRVKRTTQRQISPKGEALSEEVYTSKTNTARHTEDGSNVRKTRTVTTMDLTSNQTKMISDSSQDNGNTTKTDPNHQLRAQSTLETTTRELSGWGGRCNQNNCLESLECSRESGKCVCLDGTSYSNNLGICKNDEYWTQLRWDLSTDPKSKTMSVRWEFTAPEAKKDVKSYTVKYWRKHLNAAAVIVDTVDSPTYQFRDLSVSSENIGNLAITLESGKTLENKTEKSFFLCYDTQLQDIQVNSNRDNSGITVKWTHLDGCSRNVKATITDMDQRNSQTVLLKSITTCPTTEKDERKGHKLSKKLRTGSSYRVNITQYPVCGNGSVVYTTTLYTAPKKPTGLKAVRKGTTYLTVSWDRPTEGQVDRYTIHAGKGGSNTSPELVVPSGKYQYNATGLEEGKDYKLKVTAFYKSVKAVGRGKTFSTVKDVPSTPMRLSLKDTATLKWAYRKQKYGNPEHFTVQYNCSRTCPGTCEQTIGETCSKWGSVYYECETSLEQPPYDDECCTISVFGVNAKGKGRAGQLSKPPTFKVQTDPITEAHVDVISHSLEARVEVNLSPDTQTGAIYKFQFQVYLWIGHKHFTKEERHCSGKDCIIPCHYTAPVSGYTFLATEKSFSFTFKVQPGTRYDIRIQPFQATSQTTTDERIDWTSPEAPPTSHVKDFELEWKTEKSATFMWKPPVKSNGEILRYNISIEYFKQNCSNAMSSDQYYIPVHNFRTLPIDKRYGDYVLDKLLPYTNYTVSVVAVNSAGQGQNWSSPFSFTTNSIYETAQLRRLNKVIGSRYVQLSWEPPCPLKEPITSYVIEWSKNKATSKDKNTTPNNSITISELQPATLYWISIKAKDTRISIESKVMTNVDVPGPVKMLRLTQEERLDKERRLFINWSTPEFPNGVITGYDVTVENNCSKEMMDLETTNETSITIPALPECLYSVKVMALTQAGQGECVEKRVFVKAGVLPRPEEKERNPLVYQGEKCDLDDATTTIPLHLPMDFLCDSSFGKIRSRGLIVINEDRQKESDEADPRVVLQPNGVPGFSSSQAGGRPQRLRKPAEAKHRRDMTKFQKGYARKQHDPTKNQSDTAYIRQDHAQKQRISTQNRSDTSHGRQRPAQIQQHPGPNESASEVINDQFWHTVFLSERDVPCAKVAPTNGPGCSHDIPKGDLRFVVGKHAKCDNKCNKFLVPGTRYRFRLFVCTSAGCTDTLKSRIIQTEAVKSDKSGLLVGVLTTIVIIIVLGIILGLAFKQRQQIKVLITGRCKDDPEGRTDDVEMTPPEIPSKPIPLVDLVAHVERMHRDSDLVFSEEYKLVTELSPKSSTAIAEDEVNRSKNRYTNVLPFDHARVKLIPLDEDEYSTDYINASYIPGPLGHRDYIAAQGPLRATVDDFWRMIWESRANAIVMLTQCKEKGKVKCEQYWPADATTSVFYGDLEVTMRSESNLPDYVIRVMDLQLGRAKRTVHQFHFLKWPDFGCPDQTYLMLNLVAAVRDHTPYNPNGPMVVHCSAGVGRSGTYIALDILLPQIKATECQQVDIFSLVMAMRKNRPLMVQRENQYIYIHDCLRDALRDESDGENSIVDDENVYQNT